jgi:transposase
VSDPAADATGSHYSLDWMLFTNRSMELYAEAIAIIDSYCHRWRIEDFHRSWKRGHCHVEETQLRKKDHTVRLALMLAAVAMRVERLKHLARTQPDAPATIELRPVEIDALKAAKRTRFMKRTETVPDAYQRSPRLSASSCEPYRELVTRWRQDGRTAMSIWQELVEKHGFTARYAAVQRFVRGLHDAGSPEARVVIETRPGEEAQVDYGDGPMVRDVATGKYRRVRLFLLTLAHSRKAVRLLTEKSSTEIWARLHEQSFRRLGGAPATVVLDNLREGVVKPDVYDPLLNPLYRDVLAHYGVVALPCRVRDPDRKGKVESGIHHTQRALRGLRFESLAAAQAWLDHWDERWADTRIHGTTKRQVAAMFADERPHLRALPVEPFRYYALWPVFRRSRLAGFEVITEG